MGMGEVMRKKNSGYTACLLALAAVLAAGLIPGRTNATEDESVRIARLESLGRLWGAVKFFHPRAEALDIDWDRALVETIPEVCKTESPEEFRLAIDHLLSVLRDPTTRTVSPEMPPRELPPRRRPTGEPVEVRTEARNGGKVTFITVKDWRAFTGSLGPHNCPLAFAFNRCAGSDGVVLDLRPPSSGPSGSEEEALGGWWLGYHLRDDLPILLNADLTLGTTRRRFHSGYAPWVGQTSGGYHSGVEVAEPKSLRAAAGPAAGKRIVLVVNAGMPGIMDILLGLQATGAGFVVFEGDDPAVLDWEGTSTMALAEGVEVSVRVEEAIGPDGRTRFRPDVIVTGGALDVAARIALGDPPPITPRGNGSAGLAPRRRDEAYSTMDYPDREHRLLALFRLWNVIHYFYPYQHLMDRPWDGALGEFIPRFERARDAAGYALAVMEIVARLQDSHAFANVGARVDAIVGTHSPAVRIRTLSGRAVVTFVGKGARGSAGLRIGDTLLAIDGESVDARRARYAQYVAASTPQALGWRANTLFLQGSRGSRAMLRVRGVDGMERTVKVKRAFDRMGLVEATRVTSSRPVYEVLPEDLGSIDLVRLELAEVDSALNAIRGTPAAIFDLRGYPKGTVFAIAPRLSERGFTAARFRRPRPIGFEEGESIEHTFDQTFEPSSEWKYTGALAVLIDERAISQSEHSCLLLESAAPGRVTFIGTPTNGANGDVTNLVLPGGVLMVFTGHDVRHADGRQLQRLGIQPDIRVEPTPKGLAEGRDEVFERALAFLKTRFPRGGGAS